MSLDPSFVAEDRPQRLAYSIKDAAAVSGLGRTTIYALISAGKLTKVKIGQRTVIPRVSLEAVLRGDAGTERLDTLRPLGSDQEERG